jgi:hypothetical protein
MITEQINSRELITLYVVCNYCPRERVIELELDDYLFWRLGGHVEFAPQRAMSEYLLNFGYCVHCRRD